MNILCSAISENNFFAVVYNILLKDDNWKAFIKGSGITLLIAITGTLIGFLIGLIVGIIRTIPTESKDSIVKKVILKIVNVLLTIYIEVFRGTPMIVQSMVIYYGYSYLSGLELNILGAAIFIVSINTGAYMAEVVRGGILSIDKGQFEAAHSLGMNHFQTMIKIILPQAVRNILPATGNEFIINIKDTSVLNVISVNELYFTSSSIAQTNYKYFQVFFVTSVIYLFLTYTVTRILRYVERKMDGPSSYTIHGSQTVPEAQIKIND